MRFFILLIPSAQKVYKSEAQFFLSDTLAQTFNNRSSALSRPDNYRELSGAIGSSFINGRQLTPSTGKFISVLNKSSIH